SGARRTNRTAITDATPRRTTTAASRRTGSRRATRGPDTIRPARTSRNLGAEASSWRRSPSKSRSRSRSSAMREGPPKAFLASLVVDAGASRGDPERPGGFLDRHAETEDELQDLPLTARERLEGAQQGDALLGERRRGRRGPLPRPVREGDAAKEAASPRLLRGAANDAEKKSLEARPPGEACPAFEDLQVARLKNVQGVLPVPPAAGESPREGGRVEPFELCLDLGSRHRSALRL